MKGIIGEKYTEKYRVSPSLKKSFVEWVVPLTKISRGWHMTYMIGNNNKAWPLEAEDII